jgi:Flp pilus assembly CpaF family ATPase
VLAEASQAAPLHLPADQELFAWAVHASSAQQAISRFTSCVLQSGVELPYRAIKSNIGDSLNVIIQLERRPGIRFVSEVLEIKGYDAESDRYDLSLVFSPQV